MERRMYPVETLILRIEISLQGTNARNGMHPAWERQVPPRARSVVPEAP